MSILDGILGKNDDYRPKELSDADSDMRKVLEKFDSLGGKPFWELSPEAARLQPTPTDAVMAILRERGKEQLPPTLGVATRDFAIPGPAGDIEARLYGPETDKPQTEQKPLPVVVYWHGGGWVIADLDVYDAGPRGMAKFADCIVVSCHYRQAPEDKFPAAHEDAFAAYQWVVQNARSFGGDPSKIAVMGESAGGNLAANVAIMARDQGVQAPVHMALIYPVAGADMNTPSYLEYENAKPLSKAGMEWFVEHVFGDKSQARDPRINLVEANLAGLPSATVIRAEIDPLCSEGEQLEQELKAAGVDVRGHTFKGVTHEFFGMALVVKDAAAAQTFVAHELKRAFGTAVLPI
jgi:acetyl esterase/lipase